MKSIHWLTTLSRFKQHINKTSTTNDVYIESLISVASSDIENYTKRKLRVRTYGANGLEAELKNGKGTNKLYMNNYPIMSVTSIHDDIDRDFTAITLKASAEYMIWKDEGIIQLYSDALNGSKFSTGVANIKIIYTAGYGQIEIIAEVNDRLKFYDSNVPSGAVVTVASGIYTPSDLASTIQTGILAATSETGHTFLYDEQDSKFIFTKGTGSVLGFYWLTGTTIQDRNIGKTIGFDISADDTSATTYTSDFSVLAIPSDLEMACIQLTNRYYKEGAFGSDRMDITMKTNVAGGSTSNVMYVQDEMPKNVKRILESYKKPSGGIS